MEDLNKFLNNGCCPKLREFHLAATDIPSQEICHLYQYKSEKFPPIESVILTDILFDGNTFTEFCKILVENKHIKGKVFNMNMCCIYYYYIYIFQ